MTEAEWFACLDPDTMIRSLPIDKFQREIRLFTAACVRRVWQLLPDGCRSAVDVSERFAKGNADETELAMACTIAQQEAQAIWSGGKSPDALAYATSAAVDASSAWRRTAANVLASISCAASAAGCAAAETDESQYDQIYKDVRAAELAAQAVLLRTFVPFALE